MQVAMCEGSDIDRGLFSDILVSYCKSKSLLLILKHYDYGNEILDDIEYGNWYDCVFIDVCMNNSHGIDIARNLRKIGYHGQIVFLTKSTGFVVESYEVGASGYILKPYNHEAVETVLDRVVENAKESASCYYIKQRSSYIGIPYSEIMYVESRNSKCILHRTEGRVYNIYERLDIIQKQLTDTRFLRSHQSYLVNMDYITQVDKQFTLTTGEYVLIRQRNIKEIRDKYLEFYIKKIRLKYYSR